MAKTYLDKTGLTYFFNKIKTLLNAKVDTTDFTIEMEQVNRSFASIQNEIENKQNIVLSGTDVPTDDLGENGDVYLQTVDYELNSIYSTSEMKVGIWIDGKPIYRKVISVTTVSGQSVYDVSSLNIDIPIDLRGYVIKSGDHRPINFNIRFTDTGTAYFVACFYASNKIYLQSHSAYAGYSGYVIIEYTKTTD